MITQEHVERPAKVNAWIDEGVLPLVAALNDFDDVMTLDSCEGYGDDPAYVLFISRTDTPRLVGELRAALRAYLSAPCAYRFRLEWSAHTEQPLAEIVSPTALVPAIADALRVAERLRGKTGVELDSEQVSNSEDQVLDGEQ